MGDLNFAQKLREGNSRKREGLRLCIRQRSRSVGECEKNAKTNIDCVCSQPPNFFTNQFDSTTPRLSPAPFFPSETKRDERRTRRGESRAIARRARVIGAEAPGATWHPHAQPGRPFSAPRPRAPAPGPPPLAPPVTLGSLPLGSRGRDAIGATTTPRPTPRRMDQIDRIFPGSRASSANGTKLAPPRFFFFGPVHLRRFSARPRDRSLEANPIGARRSSARRGPGTIGTT